MTRNGKGTRINHEDEARAQASMPNAATALGGSVVAQRESVATALVSAQNMVNWMARWQQMSNEALLAWEHMLAEAQSDVQRVEDLPSLVTASAKLANRQWMLMAEQMGAGCSQWMEGEMQLADRWRSDMGNLAQRLIPGLPTMPSGEVQEESPLAQLSRFQDSWLAATQRWVDISKSTLSH